MISARMLINSVTVTPKTSTPGADGSSALSNGATRTLTCSIQPQSSGEGLEMGRLHGTQRAVIYYLYTNTALNQNDTVTWNGRVYRVEGAAVDVGGRNVFWQNDLEVEL